MSVMIFQITSQVFVVTVILRKLKNCLRNKNKLGEKNNTNKKIKFKHAFYCVWYVSGDSIKPYYFKHLSKVQGMSHYTR